MKNLHICSKVARCDEPHLVQIVCKDMRIFVDGAILNNHITAIFEHIQRLLDTATQERYLELERPTTHIVVKITDIRVITLLIISLSPISLGEYLGQRSLSATDISCNSYIHIYNIYIIFLILYLHTLAQRLVDFAKEGPHIIGLTTKFHLHTAKSTFERYCISLNHSTRHKASTQQSLFDSILNLPIWPRPSWQYIFILKYTQNRIF